DRRHRRLRQVQGRERHFIPRPENGPWRLRGDVRADDGAKGYQADARSSRRPADRRAPRRREADGRGDREGARLRGSRRHRRGGGAMTRLTAARKGCATLTATGHATLTVEGCATSVAAPVLMVAVVVGAFVAQAFRPASAQQQPRTTDFVKYDAPVIALAHARIIDGTGGAPKDDQTIIIRDGTIAELGDAARLAAPARATAVGPARNRA